VETVDLRLIGAAEMQEALTETFRIFRLKEQEMERLAEQHNIGLSELFGRVAIGILADLKG
jgi:hypothetical protein